MSNADDLLRDPLGVGLTRYQLRVLMLTLTLAEETGARRLTGDVAKTWATAIAQARELVAHARTAAPSAAVMAAIASGSQGGDA